MKIRTLLSRGAASVAVAMVFQASQAQTWNLANDFSISANPSNNWSYGSSTTLGGFTAFTNNTEVAHWYSTGYGISGLNGWSNGGSFPFPYVLRNDSAITRFGSMAPGDVVAHPYTTNQRPIIRWTNPISHPSDVSVVASFRKVEGSATNGGRYWILQNGVVQVTGDLFLLNATANFSKTFYMIGGDTLDFVVGYTNGTNATELCVEAALEATQHEEGFPTKLVTEEGDYFSGEQDACDESDNTYYRVLSDATSLSARIGIEGLTGFLNPANFEFTFESSTGRIGLARQISFLNYDTNAYSVVSGAIASTSDETVTVSMTNDPGKFVSARGQLRARVSWAPINDEDPSQDGWLLRSDYAHWNLSD